MFLDPDPKRERNSGSGFFSSQRPIASPRDHSAAWRRKNSPLAERSQSENNQLPAPKPTVRLVKASPEISTGSENQPVQDETNGNRKDDNRRVQLPRVVHHSSALSPAVIAASAIKPESHQSTAARHEFDVSDVPASTNEAQVRPRAQRDNLLSLSTGSSNAKSEWHRRSGSSGNFSNSSTLPGGESVYAYKGLWTDSRTSQGTTLEGTPTPSEFEPREPSAAEGDASEISLPTILQPLEETSPELSTVRLVSIPPDSSPRETRSLSDSSGTSIARLDTAPDSSSPTSSDGSQLATTNIEVFPSSPTPRHQQSQESLAGSDTTYPALSSSPNVVAFSSDSPRPRSHSHPLRSFTSLDSIQSRLDSHPTGRPDTARSAGTTTSWASRPASLDEIPPLYIPKKRLRHKAASASLSAVAAAEVPSAPAPTMADEEYDTQPYPRQAFSTHLSTIASVSDPHSRSASQQLSHFSLGSGVLTIDDSSNVRPSDSWPPRQSSVEGDVMSELSSPWRNPSSDEEPGDMTMGLYREESARPQPLFHVRSPSAPLTEHRYDARSPPSEYRYNGPLPPPPPIPRSRDSEENFDTVPELAPPQLREKRSGYSLRRRSQSTPSRGHSRQVSQASETSRWSQGTTIFPTWAKAYYGYGATLLSSSQISLSAPLETQPQISKYIITRDWSHGSVISSDYSDMGSTSQDSGHFLPAIFRPRIRKITSGLAKNKKTKGAKASPRESESRRSDSMAITRDPVARNDHREHAAPAVDEPRYGSLQDHSDPRRPLPRRYSKQKNWDKMEFPRPMSKDFLTDYGVNEMNPHLKPSKRLGQRVSAWRAPSFAESLDTLLRSRCNRQILFFALGFLCPVCWMVASVLPLPKKPLSAGDFEAAQEVQGSAEDLQTAMMKLEAGDAEQRWRDERVWLKARWWRYLNRVMSVVGVLLIAAVIALAVVATKL